MATLFDPCDSDLNRIEGQQTVRVSLEEFSNFL